MSERSEKIVLYGPRLAPFTEKVRRGLLLKGLDFELREPAGPEDYRRWSPDTGLLPVLTLGEERVDDSTAILLRIDELHPEPPLLSPDPGVAQKQRQLEDWADESFLWYFMQWLRVREEPIVTTRLDAVISAGRRAREPQRFPRLRRLMAWLRAGTWERPETALLRGVSDRLGDLTNFLGARPFFYWNRVGLADLAIYGMLYSIRRDAIPGAQRLLAERLSLVEFMSRVERETGGAE